MPGCSKLNIVGYTSTIF